MSTLVERLKDIKVSANKTITRAIDDLLKDINQHIKRSKKAYEEDENAFLGDWLSHELEFFNLVF